MQTKEELVITATKEIIAAMVHAAGQPTVEYSAPHVATAIAKVSGALATAYDKVTPM